MAQIIWTFKARDQYERAIRWTARERGKTYARRLQEKVSQSIAQVIQFPRSGSPEPWLEHKDKKYRFVLAWNYKIIYRYDEASDRILILRFFHTSQDPERMLD